MIWDSCNGETRIQSLSGTLYRLVESQEQVATLGYVDNLDEQMLLEELLEKAKPPYSAPTNGFHYLLTTPFRYPPLNYGSRFGKVTEPSIFYGGCSIAATLAESAYYRFVFWTSMEAPPIKEKMRSEHTLFSVGYHSPLGIDLMAVPFDQFLSDLSHPENYAHSQQIGTAMRHANVTCFEYQSARAPQQKRCVGLFSTDPFKQKRPIEMQQWLCELTAHEVSFKQVGENTVTHFAITDFLYNSVLPSPA